MKNLTMKKINLFRNPACVIGALAVILGLILLFTTNFQVPDYYTDRELADSIAQSVYSREVDSAVKHLLNPQYKPFNIMFQIWGWLMALLGFCLIFKINKIQKLKELNIFNQKRFVYLWINLSYILLAVCYVCAQMIDLFKYVYNGAADSFGIPFFTMIGFFVYLGIIYYSWINFLAFITYNTKIKRLFYGICWGLLMVLILILAVDSFRYKFSYWLIIQNLYCLIWFAQCIYAVRYIKKKQFSAVSSCSTQAESGCAV